MRIIRSYFLVPSIVQVFYIPGGVPGSTQLLALTGGENELRLAVLIDPESPKRRRVFEDVLLEPAARLYVGSAKLNGITLHVFEWTSRLDILRRFGREDDDPGYSNPVIEVSGDRTKVSLISSDSYRTRLNVRLERLTRPSRRRTIGSALGPFILRRLDS